MQYNSTNHKNKSQVLRSTEQAKRKSRHRLMGSIFLLLVAIVILLNITSKVKPVPITPQKIEIQSTIASKIDEHKDASGIAKASNNINNASSAVVAMPKALSSAVSATIVNNTAASAPTNNAAIVTINQTQPVTPAKDNSQEDNKLNLSPRIVTETIRNARPTPEQILNGAEYNSNKTSKYYIQLVSLNDRTKLVQLQHKLTQKGIKTFIQPVKSETKTVSYRLRMGPYGSKDNAQQALAKLNEAS